MRNSLFVCILFSTLILENQNLQAQLEFKSLSDSYLQFEEKLNSNNATRWPALNEIELNEALSFYQSLQDSLSIIAYSDLDDNESLNYDMLKYIINDKIFNLEYQSYLMPLSSEGGFITSIIYTSQYANLDSQDSRDNYLKKLEDLPRYIDAQINNLDKGLEKDKIHCKLVVENCLNILNEITNKEPCEIFIFKPLTNASYLRDSLQCIKMYSSFVKLKEYLSNDYLLHAREGIGFSLNHDGIAYYRQRVKYFTSLEIEPMQVYEIGLSEVRRIRSEMEIIMKQLGFERDLGEFFDFLRNDPSFYPGTAEELLYYASWLSKKAEEFLPRYFNKLPRLPFTVNPVPEAIEKNYTAGRYSGGSMRSGKAGQYWVNTYKLDSRPLYLLPALTLHEAVPGHHLQGSLAKELENLPAYRKEYLSAYGEGWGLYSEFLGKEAGFYKTPYDEFGRLSYEMWRACRLVIDPGIHILGWTRDQAVEYMSKHTSLSLHEVNTEIDRYIGWPGQAVSYKIGELKIRELRQKAEKELGELFDIRVFHDTILANGSLPLNTLERVVNSYINQTLENE